MLDATSRRRGRIQRTGGILEIIRGCSRNYGEAAMKTSRPACGCDVEDGKGRLYLTIHAMITEADLVTRYD